MLWQSKQNGQRSTDLKSNVNYQHLPSFQPSNFNPLRRFPQCRFHNPIHYRILRRFLRRFHFHGRLKANLNMSNRRAVRL